MKRLRTVPSRGAALACIAIGIVYAVGIFSSTSVVYALLGGAGAVVAALTGAKMWFHNCFGSHLAATLLVFMFAYLNLNRWHVRYVHITCGWLVFLTALVGLALFDPAVASAYDTTRSGNGR